MGCGTHTGEQHDLRRSDSAGTEDDLVCFSGKYLASALDLHSNGFLTLKDDSAGGAVGPDRQVQPVPGRSQISDGGAKSDAIGIIEWYRSDARRLWMVMVWALRKSSGPAGSLECCLVWIKLVLLEPAGDYGTLRAMKIVVWKVGVSLDLSEVLQQLWKAPLVIAHRSPGVIVLGHSPQEYLAVDGAGAAGDLAPGDHHRRGSLGGLTPELPIVVAGHDIGGSGVAEFHLIGQLLKLGVVRACLQQQNGTVRILAEAGSHDGAGRAGTDNDHVVLHNRSPLWFRLWVRPR